MASTMRSAKSTATPVSQGTLILLGIVLPLLATFFVILCFRVRHCNHIKLGVDDFLIVLAAALVWCLGIMQIIGE